MTRCQTCGIPSQPVAQGSAIHWCRRCGTLANLSGPDADVVRPELVFRSLSLVEVASRPERDVERLRAAMQGVLEATATPEMRGR